MNWSPLRAAIARIPCASPRSVTTAPAEATCCTNGIEARASGSRLRPTGAVLIGVGGLGGAGVGVSAWLSATGIALGVGSMQSGGEAARAGGQASTASTIKRRIETSIAGGLTIVVSFANGEPCRAYLILALPQTRGAGASSNEMPAHRTKIRYLSLERVYSRQPDRRQRTRRLLLQALRLGQ